MYYVAALCVYVLVWVLCTQVCYIRGSRASNLKGNGVSQSLGAKTRVDPEEVKWESEGEGEVRRRGGGEANGRTGRVVQMGEKESERERTHTPFCALSEQTHPHMVGVSVLWSCDKQETPRCAGLQPVLGWDITRMFWARRHSNSWCLDTLLRNKNEPRINLWGMPHYQLYFHAVLLSPKCICNWTFMCVCWTFSGSPGTVLEWTADSDKCHTAWLIRLTRDRGFKSLCCVPLLDNQYAECI